jgi:hypothetical protein
MTVTEIETPAADGGPAPPDPGSPRLPDRHSPQRSGPRWWRRPGVLGTVAVLAVLGLVVLLTLLATDSSRGDDLDPRSARSTGTLALAELLRHRGIDSSRGASAGPGETLVVPSAGRLEAAELTRVLDVSRSAARIVLIAPGNVPDAGLKESRLQEISTRDPGCDVAAANVAGAVDIGGPTYTGPGPACYGGNLALATRGTTPLIALGSSSFLTNDGLDDQGNAALALGLLTGTGVPGDPSGHVVWYQPVLDPQAARPSLTSLLPAGVPWGVLQLGLAVVLVAGWRGRRLGPVVEEPLPVVVPAAETVEGRARLYAAGHARSAAAAALRAGARARLGGALDHGGEPEPGGLIASVASRSGRTPGQVAALLYGSAEPAGAAPADDQALVRLADEIDRLEQEVRAR